ncbi:MAG: site-specific DNA-methyltransferase [Clostridium sp.]|nr:site-specific DNA-methyltransferase [Clostridium sp.]
MYKRLKIAYRLLAKEGCLFISCDDNEIHTLRMLCDEIFNENNFEGHIHWRRRHNQPNDKKKLIGIVAEHILVYSRDSEYHKLYGIGKVESTSSFSNPDNDNRGAWTSNPWKAARGRGGCEYSITTPTGCILTETWYGSKETFEKFLNENRVHWTKNGNGIPRIKIYASDIQEQGQCATNWWTNELFGCNQDATDELKLIFSGFCPFDNPKPTKLIEAIVRLGCISTDAIILDFFAGSGTTGQAVLELNKEDGGNRHFILCTNNENNICEEVTYQRLKTVITGKRADGSEYSEGLPANLKYYKTNVVAKDSEEIYDDLLEHIEEMIQLKYGIKIDNKKYVIIMNDEEMDDFEKSFADYKDLQAVFINQDVLLSASQEKMLRNVNAYIIPDCYFDDELREAGELW